MSHTPGPWEADTEKEVYLGDQINMLKEDIDTEREWISIGITDKEGFAEVVALAHPTNARLIAAAPELYESLKWAMHHVEHVFSLSNPDDPEFPELLKARSVITRAEGVES